MSREPNPGRLSRWRPTRVDVFCRRPHDSSPVTSDLREHLAQALAGSYALERELGGGGMSHVFVADDTALGRKVVVKVLRADLAEGLSAERFKREIQLAARLQHPHIVSLLTAGSLPNGTLYYTMPLVDGESLRARIEREGALPIADVVQLARDVASALAHAHRHGVVHRDIKPENILVGEGGAVVADFGIAKAMQAARADASGSAGGHSSTLTQRGTSLGTPAYMAPEQAAGDAVDHRADLYALGVVMYEMLAGRPPFDDRTAQRLLAAHAVEAPEPIQRRRPQVPPAIAALVMQMLQKQPADRPRSADDVLRALDTGSLLLPELHSEPTSTVPGHGVVGPRRRATSRLRDPLTLALALVAAAATAALGWERLTQPPTRTTLRARLPLALPEEEQLGVGGGGSSITISPDGSTLAYVVRGGSIVVRRLDSLNSRRLAGTVLADNPQFSPDGRWIAFRTPDAQIRKVPVAGGAITSIVGDAGVRFSWGSGGTIVFTRLLRGFFAGLWSVSADGGKSVEFTTTDSTLGSNLGAPSFLPDGETIVLAASSRSGELTLAAVRLHEGKVVPLGISGGGAKYLDGGYLLFSRGDGIVSAVRFDPKRLRVIGDPVAVLDTVALKLGNIPELAVARNGTLVYVRGNLGRQVVEVDRNGASRVLSPSIQSYTGTPRLSPDGKRLAIAIGQAGFTSDIWVYDIAAATLNRLSDGGTNAIPEWSPDGRRVAWTSDARGHDGVWWRPWDQSGPAELLIPGGRGVNFAGHDSILSTFEAPTGYELRLVLRGRSGGPVHGRVILPGASLDRQFRLSPDGHWLAYVSDETGVRQVYAQRFPGPGPRVPVSVAGGGLPQWSRDGKELFYSVPGCCVISATLGSSLDATVIKRDTLFNTIGLRGGFDVTKDGAHFVTMKDVGNVSPPIVVFGWADEVRERVDAANRK